jgi:SHS2 domain-containing protein
LTQTRLRVEAVAADIDMERSAFDREVKAITYHELAIRQEDARWVATVVLDI